MDTIFELEKKVNRVVFRKSSVTPIAGGRRERERERERERAETLRTIRVTLPSADAKGCQTARGFWQWRCPERDSVKHSELVYGSELFKLLVGMSLHY